MTIRDMEWQMIIETLARNNNNKPKTAKSLGISLKTLYNKLNRYKFDRQVFVDALVATKKMELLEIEISRLPSRLL